MSAEFDAALAALATQVAANTDAENSALVLIQKIPDLIAAAGADPAKLTALSASLKTSADSLAAAVVANTAPAPSPEPTPSV